MKNYQLIISIIFLALVFLLVETTIINFPLTFIFAVSLAVVFKKTPVYIGIYTLAFIIDALRVSNFGITALAISLVLFVLYLYEKYSGSKDIVVAVVLTLSFSFAYSYFLSYSLFMVSVFCILLTVCWIGYVIRKKANKNSLYA